jgi:hypothetical protein
VSDFKSGYALLMDEIVRRPFKVSTSTRIAVLQELLYPTYEDEHGNIIKGKPLLTPEQARELLRKTNEEQIDE